MKKKNINPKRNSLKATSFIMPDERRMKVKVAVGGGSSRHVDGSGAAAEVGVPLFDQFPLISPLCMRLLLVKRRGGEWKTRARRLMAKQKLSVGGPLWIVGGCESEGVIFEEAVGRAGIIPETETASDTAGLTVCYFSNFSISINFLLGFHTGQLLHPLI